MYLPPAWKVWLRLSDAKNTHSLIGIVCVVMAFYRDVDARRSVLRCKRLFPCLNHLEHLADCHALARERILQGLLLQRLLNRRLAMLAISSGRQRLSRMISNADKCGRRGLRGRPLGLPEWPG